MNGVTRKPPARAEPAQAEHILDMIEDPSVRAIVGVIIAENRKLKAENTLLKGKTQIVIDQRPITEAPARAHPSVQVFPALSPLLETETESLRHAISGELLGLMGWQVNETNGRVMHGQRPVYRPGYVTAIRKVLEASGKF